MIQTIKSFSMFIVELVALCLWMGLVTGLTVVVWGLYHGVLV